MYLLKLSLRPWRRSPYSQVFTSIAVGVLLFLAGFLYWMQGSLAPVIDRLQNEQVITAYLDPALDAKDEPKIVDSIRMTVGAHPEVELVQPDKFIGHLRGEYPELARELEDLGSEMQTVIPRYVSISGILPANTVGEIRQIQGVQSAESSTDRFQNVIGAFRALKWIATMLTLGLALALTTGLIHLGRTNAYLHQETSLAASLHGSESGRFAHARINGRIPGRASRGRVRRGRMDRHRCFDDSSCAIAESDASLHAAQCDRALLWRCLRRARFSAAFRGSSEISWAGPWRPPEATELIFEEAVCGARSSDLGGGCLDRSRDDSPGRTPSFTEGLGTAHDDP